MRTGPEDRARPGGALRVALLAALLAAAPATSAEGPFATLEWADGVTTTRSGYTVWISIVSAGHRALIPEHEAEVGGPAHRAILHVECRATDGPMQDTFPEQAPHGGVYLDNHPDDPGVFTVMHPMYWILGLTGRTENRWPVRVRIARGAPIATTLVRPRTDYSAPRPGLDIALPGRPIVDAILAGGPIEVEAEGSEARLLARFEPSANARRAAGLMRTACPSGGDAPG